LENKKIILDHIEKNPGQTQSQIIYRVEIPQSTTKYHLIELIKENKIFSEKLFKIHYFPVGIKNNDKIKYCIENNFRLNNILENCKNEMSLEEIAINCNISKSIASKRLQVLESMNVIKKIKVEKKIKFCRK
jgi:predicted transcriptional regulator